MSNVSIINMKKINNNKQPYWIDLSKKEVNKNCTHLDLNHLTNTLPFKIMDKNHSTDFNNLYKYGI